MTDFQFSNHGDAYDPARHFDATHPSHGLSDHWRDRHDDVTFASRDVDHRYAAELGPYGKAAVYALSGVILAYFALVLFFGAH